MGRTRTPACAQVAVFDCKYLQAQLKDKAQSRPGINLNFFETTLTPETAFLAQGHDVCVRCMRLAWPGGHDR